jgi:hypothetical protein
MESAKKDTVQSEYTYKETAELDLSNIVWIFKKNMYDIHLGETYSRLKNILSCNIPFKEGVLPPREYLQVYLEFVHEAHRVRHLPIPDRVDKDTCVIVRSHDNDYTRALRFTLISYNPVQIPLFLEHQKKEYKGPFTFSEIVRTTILDFVANNSPFDNEKRATIISNWVRDDQRHEQLQAAILERSISQGTIPDSKAPTQFSAFLHPANPSLIAHLKEKTKGKKAYKFVSLITALLKLEHIKQTPSLRQLYLSCTAEFGDIGSKTAFNNSWHKLMPINRSYSVEEKAWVLIIQDFLKSPETGPPSTA